MFPNPARVSAAGSTRSTRSRTANQAKVLRGRTRPNLPLSSKYKTEMCHYLAEQGRCPFGDQCTYAHSKNEMRYIERHPKHKTLPCRDFSTVGFCPFGERCSFIHYKRDPADILKPNSPTPLEQNEAPAFYQTQSWSTSSSVSLSVSPLPMDMDALSDIDTASCASANRLSWPWNSVGPRCESAMSTGSATSQEFLRVPGALTQSRQFCGGSMSSVSGSSSSGYSGTPSVSPYCSRSSVSGGTLSRASSTSNLSDIAGAAWPPTQLQFGCELTVPGSLGASISRSVSCEDLNTIDTSACMPTEKPRLPVFKTISTKCDEINFNFL